MIAILFITSIILAKQEKKLVRMNGLEIHSLDVFGELERPRVVFSHDQHMAALEKKDCLTCHEKNKNGFSLNFKGIEGSDKKRDLDVYHKKCISCHRQTALKDKITGPVVCGGCHVRNILFQKKAPFNFDSFSHSLHEEFNECNYCHHEEEEDSCQKCHKDVKEQNKPSMREMSHGLCVGCHLNSQPRGPIFCGDCHNNSEGGIL